MESTNSNLDPAWLARTLDEKLINCNYQTCIPTSLPPLSSQSQLVGNSSSSSSREMGCRKRIKEDGDEKRNNENCSSVKKRRMEWTPELHAKFEQAVHHLGVDKCGPKKILEMMETMGVAYLTREQVASHLQKYRLSLLKQQRENEEKAAAAAAIRFPPSSMNLHHHNNMAIPDDLSRRRFVPMPVPVQMPTAAYHPPPHISDTPSLLPPPCFPPRFKQFNQGFYNIPHSMPTPYHSIFRPREENHTHNNWSAPLPLGYSYSGRINQNQQQQGYSYACHAFVDSILRNNDDEDEDPSATSNK